MTPDGTIAPPEPLASSATGTAVPRIQHAHLSREQILRATARSLGEAGYDATTIRKIAGMLGCAVGSIYRYFKDKRELLYAVTQELLQPVSAMVEHGGPLEETVTAYHRMASGEEATYRLMFWLASVGPTGQAGPPALDPEQRVPAIVRRIISGWARQIGDEQLARRVWTKVHGAVMLGDSIDETLRAIQPLITRIGTAHEPRDGAVGGAGGSSGPQIVTRAIPVPAPSHHDGRVGGARDTEDLCLL